MGRYSGFIVGAAVLLLCVLAAYLGGANIQQAQAKLDKVRATNLQLDRDNRAMYHTIQNLRLGGAALEQLCRAELNLMRSDEIVYILPKD